MGFDSVGKGTTGLNFLKKYIKYFIPVWGSRF